MICTSNCILNTVLVLILIIIVSCVNSKNISTNETTIITTSIAPLLTTSNELKNSSNMHHNKINAVIPRNSEARETKWSYYYMTLWTYNAPLWFLLYFVFYLAFCTIRSIYNHHVDPDDFLRKRRSIEMDLNDLAHYALSNIQNFENKFVDDS
ncbi:hypothetical protein PVAND_007331 [Polypedilum vanderplanki]|uniref:Uncharacterized protein n=1 Tax=Polypedilum vanderplanki TaxID=319348 RepID=A0A9J6C7H9_POLVA|nr:hypothetical protein PVAND_007331 [Polypedilum vanderplanki]